SLPAALPSPPLLSAALPISVPSASRSAASEPLSPSAATTLPVSVSAPWSPELWQTSCPLQLSPCSLSKHCHEIESRIFFVAKESIQMAFIKEDQNTDGYKRHRRAEENRTAGLLNVVVVLATAAVAYTDWFVVANVSLGYLYVLPIALSALVDPPAFTIGL